MVFAKKDAHRYKNAMLQKMCHAWFCWYRYKACRWNNMNGFPDTRKRQNNYIIFSFYSFWIVPLSCLQYLERHFEQRTPSICISVFCVYLSHLSCLTLIIFVWPFYFQYLQSSQHAFVDFTTYFR